jgi:hypothetical protein
MKLLLQIWKSIHHQVVTKFCQNLILAGGDILLFEVHTLNKSIWNKEELPDQWNYCTNLQQMR